MWATVAVVVNARDTHLPDLLPKAAVSALPACEESSPGSFVVAMWAFDYWTMGLF
jgi:hypothetical protein